MEESEPPHEVWMLDQSDTYDSDGNGTLDSGGTLYSILVVDADSNAVLNEIGLAGPVSDDPAPDILGISPDGSRVYAALRGPTPLTGNNPDVNNANGSTPGLGVIRVEQGGQRGVLQGVFRIFNKDSLGVERADPHGLAVRDATPRR